MRRGVLVAVVVVLLAGCFGRAPASRTGIDPDEPPELEVVLSDGAGRPVSGHVELLFGHASWHAWDLNLEAGDRKSLFFDDAPAGHADLVVTLLLGNGTTVSRTAIRDWHPTWGDYLAVDLSADRVEIWHAIE